jgi:ribonuclease I
MVLFKHLFFVFSLLFFLSIGYCFGRLNYSTAYCLKGPNFWCLNETTELLCKFNNKTIGLCGYTNKRCQIKTGDDFCKSSPPAQQQPPLEFNGGLTGVDDNYFSYYILSLYWPPSSCPLIYNETKDLLSYFCSPYTNLNQPGSERLVLHGLWPTFSTNGNYQGWPQFCSSEHKDWSNCHIDGNLCPWTNTTRNDFSQGNYEYCLSSENIEQCLVNGTQILEPERERLKVFAPGYLNKLNLFINHEWTKHGK